MILTDAELVGLSAVSGGGRLPGVATIASGTQDAVSAMEGLRVKGVLDQHGRVTRFGVVPVRAVEQYRLADRHVFANQLKTSVNDDGSVTVIHPAPDGWMLARTSPEAVMVSLLKAYPFLCQGGSQPSAEPWEPLTAEAWAAQRAGAQVSALVVRDTSVARHQSSVVVYDVRDGAGFAFDPEAGKGRVLPPWQIRARVAGLLGCRPARPSRSSDV